jgi:hypothetical protein
MLKNLSMSAVLFHNIFIYVVRSLPVYKFAFKEPEGSSPMSQNFYPSQGIVNALQASYPQPHQTEGSPLVSCL